MNDLISVIIPIYNVDKYLNNCLASVVNQSYDNLEIILINDGSTDTCKDICQNYSKLDKRIMYIEQMNMGLSYARNKGISIARGNYISFVDSDDYIDNDYIEMLYSNILNNKLMLACCNYRVVDEDHKVLKIRDNILDNDEVIFHDIVDSLYYNIVSNDVIVWNKMYHRNLFTKIKFPENKTYEDAYIMHLIIESAQKIHVTSKTKYNYLKRSDSISNKSLDSNSYNVIDAYFMRYTYLTNKYVELEPICRKYLFVGLFYLLDKFRISENWHENINSLEHYLDVLRGYKYDDCSLSLKQMNQLTLIFENPVRFIRLCKAIK